MNSVYEPTSQESAVGDSAPKPGLALAIEEGRFGICRMSPKSRIPRWVYGSSFFTISRSQYEQSIVCEQDRIPKGIRCERDWRAIRVLGPLDFSLIGVLASLANPLTDAKVSIFCISTYDTDYLLVRQKNLKRAKKALEAAGHRFEDPAPPQQQDEEAAAETPAKKQDEEAAGQAPTPSEEPESQTPAPRKRRRRTRRKKPSEATAPVEQASTPVEAEPLEEMPQLPEPEADTKTEVEFSNLDLPVPDLPPAMTSETEPTSDDRPRSGSGAKDRVARALADLSSALKAPWRSRPSESPSEEGIEGESEADSKAEAKTTPEASEAETSNRETTPEDPPETTVAAESETAEAETTPKTEVQSSTRTDGPRRSSRRGSRRRPGKTRTTETPDPTPELDSEGEMELDWESQGRAEKRPDSESDPSSETVKDDEVEAEGLFTGAIPQNPVELTDQSFGHLGLSNPILETVLEVGFQHPTPIQAQVIPEALKGRDVVGLAETGSGKTAAFCLPLAERLTHGRGIRGLILCPTREIALQTKAFLDIFGRDHELETVAVIGGVKMGPQIRGFKKEPDILVATPGRLADHLRRGNVHLKHLKELVLDEADHMLDLGFLPQIKEILQQASKKRRTMMFSATMPPPIERLAQMFMDDPVRFDIRPVGQVAEGIEHRLYLVRDEDMKSCLLRLLEEVQGSTLVFSRRKLYTEWLARQMEQAGMPVARIHSDRSQGQRVQALRGFREGKYRILVATDVAARGLDVPRIEHVINYGLPETIEDYVHRAGRTARGNSAGIVSSIGTWQDKITVREIERTLGIKLPRCEVAGVEAYKELPKRKGFRRRRLL